MVLTLPYYIYLCVHGCKVIYYVYGPYSFTGHLWSTSDVTCFFPLFLLWSVILSSHVVLVSLSCSHLWCCLLLRNNNTTTTSCVHFTFIYYQLLHINQVGRVFANGPEDLGSIPGHVIPKTLKMVLDTSLLNTLQYKVRIKGKVQQSRERSSTLPYTSV